MKRFCALLLALCMLFALAPVASAANGTIVMNLNSNTMTVDGKSVAIDADASIKPQVKKINGAGYTMLPLRAVVEAMGGTVAYNSSTKVITMTYGGNTMTHTIGTKTATVNGASKTMTIASYAENNRTYVHLRAIELLSSSIKVDWNASDPNKVTITYPQQTASNTKSVNLTIKNSTNTTYLQFTSLKLAPAGTKTYSGNLLNTTLIPGGTRSLTMSIAPGKYDLCGTDINNNTWYWYNLDFTNVKSSAYLTLTSGSMYTLSLDSQLVGDQTAQVTLINSTGATITGVEVFHSSGTVANATKVYSGTLYSGSYTSFALPYTAASPYYYVKVTFSYGSSITYSYVNLGQSYVTVNLRGDGTFSYGSAAATSGVYFVNKTGSKISTLQMKVGSSGSWSTNLLTGSLKSGDYIEITGYGPSELRNQTVYFRTSTSGNGKSVSVSSTLKNSLVFSLGSSLSVKYDVKPGDVSYEEGLWLYNDTGKSFDEFYVLNVDMIDEDDYDYDFDEIEDYFEDHDTSDRDYEDYDASDFWDKINDFDDGDEVFVDEWDADDLASADIYFMGWVDADNDNNMDSNELYYGYGEIGNSKKFSYNVYMELDLDSSDNIEAEVSYDYTEDDDDDDELESGLIIFNDTTKKIDKICLSTKGEVTSTTDSDIEETLTSIRADKYKVSDKFDRYRDISGETVYYYIEFDGGNVVKGSVEIGTSSTKVNACIIVDSSTSSSDKTYDVKRDWEYSESGDGVYLYNDSGSKITKVEVSINDGSYKTVYDSNISKNTYAELDLDFDDIEGEPVYFRITIDGDKYTTRTRTVSDDLDDEENVVFNIGDESSSSDYDYKMTISYSDSDAE